MAGAQAAHREVRPPARMRIDTGFSLSLSLLLPQPPRQLCKQVRFRVTVLAPVGEMETFVFAVDA